MIDTKFRMGVTSGRERMESGKDFTDTWKVIFLKKLKELKQV